MPEPKGKQSIKIPSASQEAEKQVSIKEVGVSITSNVNGSKEQKAINYTFDS